MQEFLEELPNLISDVIIDKNSCFVTSNKIIIDSAPYTIEDGKFGIQAFGIFLDFVSLCEFIRR